MESLRLPQQATLKHSTPNFSRTILTSEALCGCVCKCFHVVGDALF